MPTLAESLRATLSQWAPPADQPTPPEPSEPPTAGALLNLPLSLIRTDPHQPRRYLPDDLRERFQAGQADASATLRALLARVGADDPEAAGYLASLRDLAASIAAVGLQHPLRVSQETTHENGGAVFRIVDGERRFWALVLLDLEAPQAAERQAPAILHDPAASADDIQRAQWAANLCREDIAAIDVARAVWRIREDYFARLAVDPASCLAALGSAAAGAASGAALQSMSRNDMAVALTRAEAARLTGRAWAERTLYAYLAVADKVQPQAAALARAYGLSLRQLQGLANLREEDQVRAILRAVGKADGVAPAVSNRGAGRPTALQRGIHACIALVGVLQQLTERNLARTSPDDRQSLLAELEQAAAQVGQASRLLAVRATHPLAREK